MAHPLTINSPTLDRIESWVIKNSNKLALAIIVPAFAIRVFYSTSCYLNPDEAMHFNVAWQNSFIEAYEAAFRLAHPPLLILVLHGILFLGKSELILRLPSLLGGTAALWLAFAWMRRCLGEIPALVGLFFLAVTPAAISASTEVRQYGLLLFFICGSLYATERAFTERSATWAVVQGLSLLGAVLTDYTSILVLLPTGLYILLRTVFCRPPGRLLVTIVFFQFALLLVLCWLYFGHIRGTVSFGKVPSIVGYLRPYYFQAGHETPIGFIWRALSGTLLRLVGARKISCLFALAFLAGLIILAGRKEKAPALTALLIVSPFIAGFVAALFHAFPFSGSRHQAYLLPFFAAGISAGFTSPQLRRSLPILLVGLTCALIWPIRAAVPDNRVQTMPIREMTAAMNYLHHTVPPGAVLFVDDESRHVLKYYLTRNDQIPEVQPLRSEPGEQFGGYRISTPTRYAWAFNPLEVTNQVAELQESAAKFRTNSLWIISVGWQESALASRCSFGTGYEVQQFGDINVIKVLPSAPER